MKKIIGLLVLLFLICIEKGFAYEMDTVWKAWRSSETTTVETDVLIATGNIHFKDVTVASGTITGTAQIQFFNSTGTIAGGVSRSSSTVYNIENTGDRFEINQVYNEGLRYTKTGISAVVIKWDWVSSIPMGKERTGLK